MDVTGTITAVASLATTVGVFLTGWQVRLAKRQAIAQFEDSLDCEYRDIIRRIPAKALRGRPLTDAEQAAAEDAFYHYLDLTNGQIFLRQQRRVCNYTWNNWQDGIRSNMHKSAFRVAWGHIKTDESISFEELRRLEASNFQDDPIKWKMPRIRSAAKPPGRLDGKSGQGGGTMLQAKAGNHDSHA